MEEDTMKKIDALIESSVCQNNLLALHLLLHVVGFSYEQAMLYFVKDMLARLHRWVVYMDGKDLLCTRVIKLDFGPFILKYGLSYDGTEHKDMDYFVRRFIVHADYKDDFEQLLQQPLRERIWGYYKGYYTSNSILLDRHPENIHKSQKAAYFRQLEVVILEDYSITIGLLRQWLG
jgi:hypothetical protein